MKKFNHRTIVLSALVSFSVALSGCSGGGGGSDDTTASASFDSSATVMVAANSNATSPRAVGVLVPEDLTRMVNLGPVDSVDIDSLWVTITEITLDRVGNPNPGGPPPPDDDAVVEVSNYAFTPNEVDITVGNSVTWVWVEDGLHTVTSGVRGEPDAGELFDAPGELTGDSFVHTFQISGDVPYFSDLDFDAATGMTGVVHVNFDNSKAPPKITVFRGAVRVNLKDLDPISEILSMAAIPSGRYNGIRLRVEDPELFLASDPSTPITDIQLTANGNLFIKEKFEVLPDENILIIIDFGDIHLVETGSGKYVLTPQLRVLLDLLSADVEIHGVITAIDAGTNEIVVMTDLGDEILVDLTALLGTLGTTPGNLAFSNGDFAEFADLMVGQTVSVNGTLYPDNTVEASSVVIQVEE